MRLSAPNAGNRRVPRFRILVLAALLGSAGVTWAGGGAEAGSAVPPADAARAAAQPPGQPAFASRIVEETPGSLTYLASGGSPVRLTRFPKRTVILFSSALDLWYLAGGTAVGRVQSSTNVPEAAREIEIVGSMSQPNLEKLVALHPDLVVLFPMMSRQRDLKELLDQQGVESVFIEYTNYHEFLAVLDLFARLNHPRPEEADRLIRSISERVEAVVDRCPKDRHPRVLMLFATARGMQVELPGSHIGTIVEMLGGRNVIDDVRVAPGVTRVEYALERIYQKDPDLILVTVNQDVGNQGEGLAGQLRADAAWGNLRAVREGNVHVLPERFFLYKPNGQFPQAFQHVAAILYPQAAQP